MIECNILLVSYPQQYFLLFFVFKQKTAYEMRISDWSSDVCSSDLVPRMCHCPKTCFLRRRPCKSISHRPLKLALPRPSHARAASAGLPRTRKPLRAPTLLLKNTAFHWQSTGCSDEPLRRLREPVRPWVSS